MRETDDVVEVALALGVVPGVEDRVPEPGPGVQSPDPALGVGRGGREQVGEAGPVELAVRRDGEGQGGRDRDGDREGGKDGEGKREGEVEKE